MGVNAAAIGGGAAAAIVIILVAITVIVVLKRRKASPGKGLFPCPRSLLNVSRNFMLIFSQRKSCCVFQSK